MHQDPVAGLYPDQSCFCGHLVSLKIHHRFFSVQRQYLSRQCNTHLIHTPLPAGLRPSGGFSFPYAALCFYVLIDMSYAFLTLRTNHSTTAPESQMKKLVTKSLASWIIISISEAFPMLPDQNSDDKRVKSLYRTLLYTILGYLTGSLLFAGFFGQLLKKKDVTAESPDHNPGVYNAFLYGGLLCGILTLCFDLLKGFLPVYFYLRAPMTPAQAPFLFSVFPALFEASAPKGLTLVLAAPVLGHIFPLWHRFHGGKGITVTFGCLLGLFPRLGPVLILAGVFLFFSLILKITPNSHRTFFTYLLCTVLMYLLLPPGSPVPAGFLFIAAAVAAKLLSGPELRKKCEVKALWKR